MRLISVIIPTYNEEGELPKLLGHLQDYGKNEIEIIVVDAGSIDKTRAVSERYHINFLFTPIKGRAAQMNYGAAHSHGEILYFVHADTLPPKSYVDDIYNSVNTGFDLGRYRSKYNSDSWLLKINAFLSRFDTLAGMGGDQTLFVTKKLFNQCGGFSPSMRIMEEFNFCQRARKNGKYKILRKPVLISARKYEQNSWLTVQWANIKVFRMYSASASQESLVATYRSLLKL